MLTNVPPQCCTKLDFLDWTSKPYLEQGLRFKTCKFVGKKTGSLFSFLNIWDTYTSSKLKLWTDSYSLDHKVKNNTWCGVVFFPSYNEYYIILCSTKYITQLLQHKLRHTI